VHEKISLLHESECIALPPRTTLISIVIPSTRYLDRIDPHRAMYIDDLREHIRPGRHLFEDMLANPIQFESDHPYMTIDEMVALYEFIWWNQSKRSGVPGRWGSWKCMCDSFMLAALCGHSLLFALLYDKTLEFSAKHSSKKLELRGKTARRSGAWAPEQEDEEEAEAKLEWCPVTACDDMDLLPAKKAKIALHLHFISRPHVFDFRMFAWNCPWTCFCQACHSTYGGCIR
jgi:hypothetical protein